MSRWVLMTQAQRDMLERGDNYFEPLMEALAAAYDSQGTSSRVLGEDREACTCPYCGAAAVRWWSEKNNRYAYEHVA